MFGSLSLQYEAQFDIHDCECRVHCRNGRGSSYHNQSRIDGSDPETDRHDFMGGFDRRFGHSCEVPRRPLLRSPSVGWNDRKWGAILTCSPSGTSVIPIGAPERCRSGVSNVAVTARDERMAAYWDCALKRRLSATSDIAAVENEREFSRSHTGLACSDQGAAFLALTRWHSCGSPCRTPAGAQSRAPGVLLRRALQGCRFFVGSLRVRFFWPA